MNGSRTCSFHATPPGFFAGEVYAIREPSVYIEFFAAREQAEGAAVGDRLTGMQYRPVWGVVTQSLHCV